MRLSELREYSQRPVEQARPAREVSTSYVPNAAAAAALRRSYTNGLALTETGGRKTTTQLGGLGELVQVVT